MKYYLLLITLLLSLLANAQQYPIKGIVVDSASGEPLAFVNILINESKNGGMTDIDGNFSLSHNEPVVMLQLSYVGYYPLKYKVDAGTKQIITMRRQTFELAEVEIDAGENPAHRIIRNVIQNRHSNDPSNIRSYSYTSYDKMIFTVPPDSAGSTIKIDADSNDIKLQELLKKQHFFMMESVAEHKYIYPSTSHDKVIATKVSGLSDPLFVFLLSQSQPESFYKETIAIAGKNYLNPLTDGFDKRYFFWIRDTLFNMNDSDTTFIISFKPQKGKNFDGLKGLLYISNQGWAVANVIAKPARDDEKIDITIQQQYELLFNKQWFPVQLNTDIIFNSFEVNSSKLMAIGKSYRKDIVLEPELVKKEFEDIAIEVLPEANFRDELFWRNYRNDSLSLIERNTYRVIDSLGREHKFDRMSKLMTSLISGSIPIGIFDIDINRLFRFNVYEKVYLGLGLYTNNNLTRYMSVGGYAGFGFGDKDMKYGSSIKFNLLKYDALGLSFKFQDDLEEAAGTRFFDDAIVPFNEFHFRNFYISKWDNVRSVETIVNFRPLRYVTASAGIERADKKPMYDYSYQHPAGDVFFATQNHTFDYINAGFRFAYKEKFIRSSSSRISMGTVWPVLWVQYTGGKSSIDAGNVSFNRIDMKASWSVFNKLFGKTNFMLHSGFIDNDAPYSELFNGRGSAGESFSVFSAGSFVTMKPSEFLSDKYASLFIEHNFGKLLMRTKIFEPDLSAVLNMGVGSLSNPDRHRQIGFRTMELGYYETGLLVSNIIKSSFSGIGAGVFYRMGPNGLPTAKENLMFRLSLKYSM